MSHKSSKLQEDEKPKKQVSPSFNATLMKAPLSPISENKNLSFPFRWFISLTLTFQVSLHQTPSLFSPRKNYGYDYISPIAPKRLSFPPKDDQGERNQLFKKLFHKKSALPAMILLLIVIGILSLSMNLRKPEQTLATSIASQNKALQDIYCSRKNGQVQD